MTQCGNISQFNIEDWATAQFRAGWEKATAEGGARWLSMWYEWHNRYSIYADGYLAACDYYDENGWPHEKEEQHDYQLDVPPDRLGQ